MERRAECEFRVSQNGAKAGESNELSRRRVEESNVVFDKLGCDGDLVLDVRFHGEDQRSFAYCECMPDISARICE